MRRWSGVAFAVLVLGGALFWWGLPEMGGASSRDEPGPAGGLRKARVSASRLQGWLSEPVPAGKGSLSIHGRVLGPDGPLPGVVVLAVKPEPGLIPRLVMPCGCHPSLRSTKEECSCGTDAAGLDAWLEQWRGGDPPVSRATTDAAGRFSLEGLEEGTFQVWAEGGGQGTALRTDVPAGSDGVELRLGGGAILDIAVLDEDESPVVGARVTAWAFEHGHLFEGLTGDEGRLRIGPLPPGEYHVFTGKEGWLPELARVKALGEHPVAVSLFRARTLAVRVLDGDAPVRGARIHLAGEQREHRGESDTEGRFSFGGLRPEEAYEAVASQEGRHAAGAVWLSAGEEAAELVLDLSKPSLARGTVRDEEGRPLADAVLKVTERTGPHLHRRKLLARSSADGTYELGPLPRGRYVIRALAEDFLSQSLEWKPEAGPLDFTLKHALLVEGDVVDAQGRPLKDALLRLLDTERGLDRLREVGLAKTEADGTFRLETSQAGDFLLAAYHRDFAMAKVRVTVPRRGVRLVLEAGAELVGEVVDSRGRPVEAVDIITHQMDGGDPAALAGSDTTDVQGRFTVRGLAAGRYKVLARQGEEENLRAVEATVEVESLASSRVRLVLPAGLPLAGAVVDTEGRPLSGVLLIIDPRAPSGGAAGGTLPRGRTLTTGRDGRFRIQHLEPGDYEVIPVKDGYLAKDAQVTAEASRSARFLVTAGAEDVRWVLQREAAARGRVTRQDGSPVKDALVNGRDVAEADGRFSIPLHGKGEHQFTFIAPGLAPTTRTVPAREEEGDVDLGTVVMRAGIPVRGRVVDAATGAPVAGALVAAEERPAAVTGQARLSVHDGAVESGANGTFELPHVEEGRRTLAITHPSYVQRRLALAPGQRQVQVALEQGSLVHGTVRSRHPYDSCWVNLQAEDGSSFYQVKCTGAAFERRGVPAGSYVASLVVFPQAEPHATFAPQRVLVPSQGQVSVDFEERREGVKLRLQLLDEVKGVLHWALVPGEVEFPWDNEALLRSTAFSYTADYADGFRLFTQLPAGAYTLLLVRYHARGDGHHLVHHEVFRLPGTGVVTHAVRPDWHALATGG